MMTIRFPSGFSIRYNTANYVNRLTNYSDLYEKQGGKWIAQVPLEALIEIVPADSFYNPLLDTTHHRIAALEKEVRGLKRAINLERKSRGAR